MEFSFPSFALNTSKSTGGFSAVLPDPVQPTDFVADKVELGAYVPGSRMTLHAVNTSAYGREYAFAFSLPETMGVGAINVYEITLYPNNRKTATAGLIVGSNDGPIHLYFGVGGSIEVNYSVSEKRLKGKFFFMTIGGKKFEGEFNVVE